MGTLDRPGEPEITPPPESRVTECVECGDVLRGEEAWRVQDLEFCGACGARRCVDVLDPQGSLHVTERQIAEAARLLTMWAAEAMKERLNGFAGTRPPLSSTALAIAAVCRPPLGGRHG